MKNYILPSLIIIIIIGTMVLGSWLLFGKDSLVDELSRITSYSKAEINFLKQEGFLNDIDSENLPSNKEQIISLLKSVNLIEQNLNSPDESFEVLATKLDENTYQLAFKLENKSNQTKEFYLIPISESSQTEFKEIKGVVKNGKVSWGNQGDWGYDIEKHKQELRPELAKAYDDIEKNGYTGKPIKLVLEANSTLLAQSKWEISRGPTCLAESRRASDSLKPVYLLVYGSAGGVKDELVILNIHSHPKEGDYWKVSFETKGLRDLIITPEDQNTINDLDFVSLKCGDKVRTPQILENDVIFYENWYCFEQAEIVHLITRTDHHTLKFQFGKQEAYAYNSPDLIDNLISYWKLDDNFDNSNVDDIHSTNDGTFNDAGGDPNTDAHTIAGQVGTALTFDGDDDYVDLGTSDTLNITSDHTIVAWIKGDSIEANDGIFSRMNRVSPYEGYTFEFQDDSELRYYNNSTSWKLSTDFAAGYFNDTWRQIAVVVDVDSGGQFYVDGQPEGSWSDATSAPASNSGDDAQIGRFYDENHFFSGLIDEVAIWDRALTAGEISDLYNSGNGLAYPFNSIQRGVVSHWKLDDNLDDDVVLDAHNDNDGAVDNGDNNYSSEMYTATAKIGSAFDFDGNDEIVVSSDLIAKPYTILMWVNLDTKGTIDSQPAFLQTGAHYWTLDGANSQLQFYNGSWINGTGGTLSLNEWHLIAICATDSDTRMYIDTTEVYSGAEIANDGGDPIHIGKRGDQAESPWNVDGKIDEVTIWNRALTQAEITALYNSGDGLAYPFTIVPSVGIKGSTIRIRGAKVKIK